MSKSNQPVAACNCLPLLQTSPEPDIRWNRKKPRFNSLDGIENEDDGYTDANGINSAVPLSGNQTESKKISIKK